MSVWTWSLAIATAAKNKEWCSWSFAAGRLPARLTPILDPMSVKTPCK
jgi:hypothetical protein